MPFRPRIGIPYGLRDLRRICRLLPDTVDMFPAQDCRAERITPDFALVSSRTLGSEEDLARAAQFCKDWNIPGILLCESPLTRRLDSLPFLYGMLPEEDVCDIASLIEWVLEDWQKDQQKTSVEAGVTELAWATADANV